MLHARLRARLRSDERGFTIIESMIAITVIFASLTALAYTATIGFKATAYARERITADGVANQIMEEIRGLAYSKIQSGLSSTDLAGDSNIVSCSGVYRFESCSGEKIISSTGLSATTWLVPHTGSLAASSTTNNVAMTWAVYVTNNDTSHNPYRVTVIVNWASKIYSQATNSLTRVQSLFWSPSGCVSSSTHPFAAPCNPYFYAEANVQQGNIVVAGNVDGLSFTDETLATTGATATGQSEQVTSVTSSASESGVTVHDGTGTHTEGGNVTTSTAADSDPAIPSAAYQDSGSITGTGGTVTTSAGSTSVSAVAPAGDTYRAEAAVTAKASNSCPPQAPAPAFTSQADNLPCAGANIQPGSTALSSSLTMNGIVSTLGTATLGSVAQIASNPQRAFVNREAIAGANGRIDAQTIRRFGTISLGGIPSGMTSPAGFTGYYLTISGYQDAETVQAGTTAAGPSAPAPSGSVSVWNGTNAYTSYALNAAGLTGLAANPVTKTQTINGQSVTWTVSMYTGGKASTTSTMVTNQTGASGAQITDTDATITPFICTLHYVVTVDAVTKVDLDINLDLGQMTARAIYGPPPVAG
jgi:Tfp pilus assembly protein PilV